MSVKNKKNNIQNIKIVFFLILLAKIASFLSEIVIANSLGTSIDADVYSMVNGAYIVIYPMIGVGIWSGFLPKYKKLLAKNGKKQADTFANKIINLFGVISLIFALLFFFFSKQISGLVAPGFSIDAKDSLSIMLKIFAPYFVFDTISTIYASMLQSHGKFFGSQIREVVCYLPTIFVGPYLYSVMGVYGFALALIIGVVIRLLVLLPSINWGYKYELVLNIKDSNVKSLTRNLPFLLISSGLEQIHSLVDKIMASNLLTGAVSGLNYGHKLINVFNGVITTPITTVYYPQMAEMVEKNEIGKLKKLVSKILSLLIIITVPITIMAALYSNDIVRLVFQRGQFDSNSTAITSTIFRCYSIGILFSSIKLVTDKVLYSLEKVKIVAILSFINVALNIILNVLFSKMIGAAGLALATSISTIIYVSISFIYLQRYITFNVMKTIIRIFKIIIINTVSLILPYIILSLISIDGVPRIIINITIGIIIEFVIFKTVDKNTMKEITGLLKMIRMRK